MNIIKLSFIVLSLILSSTSCFAFDSSGRTFPAAILVQLRTEQSRINALTKARDYKTLEKVKTDARGVRAAFMADFNDHFSFCPVYFFEDTNLDLIKNRHFEGILLNADGEPAINPVLNDTCKDYLIVYYGYPSLQQRNKSVVTDSEKYKYNSGEPFGKGLIINNYKYQQISFFYRFGYYNFFKGKRAYGKYAYESKKYEMEYYPFAEKLNKEIAKQTKIRISNQFSGMAVWIWD